MKAKIIVSTGARLEMDDIESTLTVLELKQRVAAAVAGLDVDLQKAIYRGRVLTDDRTLADISFEDGDSIHIVRGARRELPPASATVPTANSGGQAALPGMGGMDPDAMRTMMDNPLMQHIMSDPEMLRTILFSNPQMREVVENNPEIGHLLSDPATLRQTMATARNPELMREMMRTTDRAMSNIESHPEGFNALRRMYNTIQEPLSQPPGGHGGGGDEPTGASRTSSQQPEAPNTSALPNPWAAPERGSAARADDLGAALPFGGFGGGAARGAAPTLGGGGAASAPPGAGLGAAGAATGGRGGAGADAAGNSGGMLGSMFGDPALMQDMLEAMQDPVMQQLLGRGGSGAMGFGGMQAPQQQQQPGAAAAAQQQQQQQQQQLVNMFQQQLAFTPPAAGGAATAATPSGAQAAAPTPTAAMTEAARAAAESRYSAEIDAVTEMGFDDRSKILDALIATGGNINAAVARLLG